MKKLLQFMMPIKTFAAMIFTGFMCLYMVTGSLYSVVSNEPFDYTILFAFILQGLVLALLIFVLWSVFIGDAVIKKMRYFWRHLLFELSLVSLLTLCFRYFPLFPPNGQPFG